MFPSHSWADDSDPDSSPSSPMSKRNLKPAPDPSYPVVQQHPDPIPTGVGGPFPEAPHPQQVAFAPLPPPPASPSSGRKRKAPGPSTVPNMVATSAPDVTNESGEAVSSSPATKKSRTNTPWSPAEEQRLKTMRDAGSSWSEIAKTFPTRTEGSVKKHWYKDMHYAEFAEDESAALLSAIKEYEASKWKVIGQKVGKPAKACEQYAKEHFGGKT